jgi:general secretion pathway protein G
MAGLIFLAALGITLRVYGPDYHALDTPHKKLAADLQALHTQLTLYQSMNAFYPTTEQGLQALVVEPKTSPRPVRWYQLYSLLPKDPWGSEYVYLCPGRARADKYDLFSAGPDRAPFTADDDWGY